MKLQLSSEEFSLLNHVFGLFQNFVINVYFWNPQKMSDTGDDPLDTVFPVISARARSNLNWNIAFFNLQLAPPVHLYILNKTYFILSIFSNSEE